MKRRRFIAQAALLLVGCRYGITTLRAQAVRRIGVLESSSPATGGYRIDAFRRGLRDLGYVEGRDLALELRWGNGDVGALPGLATELVRAQVDVILAGS